MLEHLPCSSLRALSRPGAALNTDTSVAGLSLGLGKGRQKTETRIKIQRAEAQSTAQAKLPRVPGFSGPKYFPVP